MNMTQSSLVFLAFTTLLTPLIFSIGGLLVIWRYRSNRQANRLLGLSTVVASGVVLLISILMISAAAKTYPLAFSLPLQIITVDFHIDALSLFFILLVNVVAFVSTWNAIPYLGDTIPDNLLQHPAFFHASINFFHFTMLLVPMLDNLIGLWIAIELTTLFSTFLVGHRNTKDSWEAAWKYLIITSTGIILALLGTMFLANAIPKETGNLLTGNLSDKIMDWTFLMRLASQGELIPDFVKLSFLFILIGYGTKAGLAPMHTWLPDGHGEAPPPISALLSGVLLKSALYAILRFYTITNATLQDDAFFTSTILLAAGLLSLIVATPFILKDNRFKRILAYHSLEHMGIITFGIGIGSPIAMFGALLHALNHAITKSLMFLSHGNIMRQYEQAGAKGQEFDPNRMGVLRSMPLTGTILTIGGLALVGTPPFNIFFSEFTILWGALSPLSGQPTGDAASPFPKWVIIVAVILFMLSTTLIFYGLIKHLARLVLGKTPGDRKFEEKFFRDLFPLLFLLIFVLLFGLGFMPVLSGLLSRSVDIVLNKG